MSLPRFHLPEAAPGARLELPDHAAHHAREVLRLRPGAQVRVFDGRGTEFEAVIEALHRRQALLHLGHAVQTRPEAPLRIVAPGLPSSIRRLCMAAATSDRVVIAMGS